LNSFDNAFIGEKINDEILNFQKVAVAFHQSITVF
jgi:hypothetical protein